MSATNPAAEVREAMGILEFLTGVQPNDGGPLSEYERDGLNTILIYATRKLHRALSALEGGDS